MTVILGLLLAHWLGDFVYQSDWMALNKSSSWTALAVHVTAYTFALVTWYVVGPHPSLPWIWLPLNAGLHFVTDAVTSRCTAALWKRGERHWFFVVIGFDQLLHYAALLGTMALLARV